MTIAAIDASRRRRAGARGRGGGGPASKRIVVAYGFWIFILSDMVMFSGLFAAYAVLSGNTAGGPTGPELFNLCATSSSRRCACCFRAIPAGSGRCPPNGGSRRRFLSFAALTFVLGAAFLFIEVTEFAGMVAKGAGPSRSAFLSGFFTLGGHARRARHQRPDLARLSGGAGRRQGLASRRAAAPVVLEPVLARAGHRLGRGVDAGLPDGSTADGRSTIACSTTARRASKNMSPRPATCRTRWGWGLRSWRRSLLSSCRKPICCGPRASRSG